MQQRSLRLQMSRVDQNTSFKFHRVPKGNVIHNKELTRRLCYNLQIPQSFGPRILKGLSSVIRDALEHGEGINLFQIGDLKLMPLKGDTVRLPNNQYVPRQKKYKLVLKQNTAMDKLIKDIS